MEELIISNGTIKIDDNLNEACRITLQQRNGNDAHLIVSGNIDEVNGLVHKLDWNKNDVWGECFVTKVEQISLTESTYILK